MRAHGPGLATRAIGKDIKVAMLNGSNSIQSVMKVQKDMTLTKTHVSRKNVKQKMQLIKNMRDSRMKISQMN